MNAVLPVAFLSAYTNKVQLIYIGISNITRIENGAFGGGIFSRIILEDLRLKMLDKTLFTNISEKFEGITIMQDNEHLQVIYPDFLEYVQFQIKYLKLQTGINCVRNITAVEPTLGTLNYADFSYNNFSNGLLDDTFRKLTMVEHLILSNSNIESLPNYIFQGKANRTSYNILYRSQLCDRLCNILTKNKLLCTCNFFLIIKYSYHQTLIYLQT